jgi:hypothetical protein
MGRAVEQNTDINICVKLQKSPDETLAMLKTFSGESPGQGSRGYQSPSLITVFFCCCIVVVVCIVSVLAVVVSFIVVF